MGSWDDGPRRPGGGGRAKGLRGRAEGDVLAAGTVLWRPAVHVKGGVEVAVVHRPRYDDWSWPKGKLEPGEHVLVAAVREVREETGHEVVLGRPLPAQHYEAFGRPKTVHYWAGRADGGGFRAGPEVDEMVWLPPAATTSLLSHERDADTLAQFTAAPVDTVPLVLLRHAATVSRARWAKDDALRPLDDRGRVQSEELAEVLSGYGPMRLRSSPSRRCLESVAPLARRWGVKVEPEPALSETGFDQRPAEAAALVRDAVESDEPTLVCSHGPVLPELLWAAASTAPGEGTATTVEADIAVETEAGLAKAGFWVLQVHRGRPVSLETHRI